MKISIEVELQADEVPLATELLNVLRSLTEHVSVSTRAPQQQLPNGPPQYSQTQPQHQQQQVQQQPLQQQQPPPQQPAPALQQQQHLQQQQQQQQLQAQLRPPAVAPAAAAPPASLPQGSLPKGASRPLFEALLNQLADETQVERVYSELMVLLSQPARLQFGPEDLLDAYEAVVLNPQLVLNNQSVAPYMILMPRLPDPWKTKSRDGLIAKVLQHLTKKRPVNVDRTQFFVHAEAFAMLVKIDFVSVDGAAQTIEKLLNKPETRSAAVTMLGKTVEMCSDKLLTKCNGTFLANLWKSLDRVTEEAFKYDVDWVTQYMGWPATQQGASFAAAAAPVAPQAVSAAAAPVAAAAAAAPAAIPHSLTALDSFQGHSETIFTLCYDALHRQLVSGGKDGNVIVWNDQGGVASRIDIPTHYVCSMDLHPRHNLLLICGVANEAAGQPTPPCIAIYDTNRNWQSRGMLSKGGTTLISCLRCMGADCDGFVTGETAHGASGMEELVCYYDLGRSPTLEGLTPVHQYKEHENLVTCVAVHPGNSNIFVSGSRDQTVRAWDKRSDRSIGIFGTPDPATGKFVAHGEMITCLDAADNLLLSTGVDGYLCAWDFRQMGSTAQACGPITRMQVDGQPILKIAVNGSPYSNVAAVSTFQGLYLVDLSHLAAPQSFPASPFTDGRPIKPYHDIKWGAGQSVLYAASENPVVDVYALTP